MKKNVISATLVLFFVVTANCQVTKGIWLTGGEAGFSYTNDSYLSSESVNQISIAASPILGYFLINKFVAGLKPSIIYTNDIPGKHVTTFNIGPFIRYYLLNPENVLNVFTEGSYAYGKMTGERLTGGDKTTNAFSLAGGSVLFFDTSVGLEFIISYSATKIIGFSGYDKEIKFGVGFKFHLEKEKKSF